MARLRSYHGKMVEAGYQPIVFEDYMDMLADQLNAINGGADALSLAVSLVPLPNKAKLRIVSRLLLPAKETEHSTGVLTYVRKTVSVLKTADTDPLGRKGLTRLGK